MENPHDNDIQRTLCSIESSLLVKKAGEIRKILWKAKETFDATWFKIYARQSKLLLQQQEWTEHDVFRAQSFVLYHIYLMFYREIDTDTVCMDFLNRIFDRYKQSILPVQ